MEDGMNSYVCHICSVTCTGPETFQQHLSGIKHLKKERQSKMYGLTAESPRVQPTQSLFQGQDYSCKVCQTVMSGPEAYIAHMAGKPHAKKLKQLELIKTLSSSNESSDFAIQLETIKSTPVSESTSMRAQPGFPVNYYFCSLCEVPLSGPESANSHYAGAQHMKKQKRSQYLNNPAATRAPPGFVGSSNFCSLCQVPLSGPESAEAHLEGAQHQRKLKQMELPGIDGSFGNLQLNDMKPENLCKEITMGTNTTDELREMYYHAEHDVVEGQEDD